MMNVETANSKDVLIRKISKDVLMFVTLVLEGEAKRSKIVSRFNIVQFITT